jgi:hypothetical protein
MNVVRESVYDGCFPKATCAMGWRCRDASL